MNRSTDYPKMITSDSSNSAAQDNTSFRDMLLQFAKLSQSERTELMQNFKPPPPYPEVTVHPVPTTTAAPTNSLLHGILTKETGGIRLPIHYRYMDDLKLYASEERDLRQPLKIVEEYSQVVSIEFGNDKCTLIHLNRGRLGNYREDVQLVDGNSPTKQNNKTSFSPTLARLLTAPEKAVNHQTTIQPTMTNTTGIHPSNMSISEILSTSKARNEITITPVTQYETSNKGRSTEEDETEDGADRLVIDEGNEGGSESRRTTDNNSETGDEVPPCQGCNQKPAQFVCAGCGNQWYCSRDCQVINH
ncbi:hypothetical protein NQ315_014354 [Exocentrus adspersus]|uniref:Reverse transcriptase domain-containing protein n=1 Tax=Exocentrus adspersus TaxID=1586481 RepID=A0AAV8V9P3_9CUCU|nr:hypothetical protein NQ315_014354 [Exocentrus adspersus]